MTSQRAPNPQTPTQGLAHFLWMQASILEHSSLVIHSGRHIGGDPWYSGKQEHTACPLWFRHTLLGPQGDGTHGSVLGGTSTIQTVFSYIIPSTRLANWNAIFTLWFWFAQRKWVSYKLWRTRASRNMIYYVAICGLAARSNTRVLTFIANASFVSRAFGTEDTLGSTTFVRIARVLGQTFANTIAVAVSIWATRRRIARIYWLRSGCKLN